MNNNFYVYQLRRADQDFPFYIGKGIGDRLNDHLYPRNKDGNQLKKNIINKSKREGVAVLPEKLYVDLSEDDALRIEVWCIHLYGRRNKDSGCLSNLTDGGEGTTGHYKTDECKRILSIKATGRFHTKESKEHMSRIKIGKKFDEAHRMKMSESAKGVAKTPEHKQNASISRLNYIKTQTKEEREYHALRTLESYNKKTQSEKDAIAAKRSLVGIMRSPGGEEILVQNFKKFCRENNLSATTFREVFQGKYRQHKGWTCPTHDNKWNQ